MNFLAWLLIVGGIYLIDSSRRNRDPKATLIATLKGQALPKEPWKPLPGIGYWITPDGDGGYGQGGGTQIVPTPTDPNGKRQVILNFAHAQLGKPWIFATSGPNSFDCSGLTLRAYKQVGINLAHHAATQQRDKNSRQVTMSSAQPGDLVFWGPVSPHVAIWLGNGKLLDAASGAGKVRITTLWDKKIATFRSWL